MPHHDAPFGACGPQAPSIGGRGPRAPFGHATPAPHSTPGAHASPGEHSSPAAGSSPGAHGSPDPELTAILPVITGATGQFRHRQHINLAYYAVRRYGMPHAIDTICTWIRQIAAYERAPQKYHYTVSRAWVEAVAYHVAEDPGCDDFEDFAARNPALLDKRLLSRHYLSSTLASVAARGGWVEPDLEPFPWSAR
jgi:hypothetical protein